MTDRNTPVTEDELHAYVDGELPADRRDAVEAWLASASRRCRARRRLARAGRSDPRALRRRRRRAGAGAARRSTGSCAARRSWRAIAAAAVRRGVRDRRRAGWLARGASAAAPSDASRPFTAEALERAQALHRRGAPSDRGAGRRAATCCRGCRAASATTLRAPDLDAFGLKLLGGRLLPGHAGRRRCSCTRGRPASASRSTARGLDAAGAALRYRRRRQVAAVYWVDGERRLGGERAGATARAAARRSRSARLRAARPTHDRRRRSSVGPISSYRCADRRACVRAICASAPRARGRCLRAARCARWRSRSPAPLFAGRPLPLRRNVRPAAGAGRDRKLDRAVERRHAHLAAEHRLVERDRQIEPQVVAVALEQRMRRDRDRDQRVAAAPPGPGRPCPFSRIC